MLHHSPDTMLRLKTTENIRENECPVQVFHSENKLWKMEETNNSSEKRGRNNSRNKGKKMTGDRKYVLVMKHSCIK